MTDKLLNAMKGKKSLNGWDVAVSYDLNKLSDVITDKMWKSDAVFNEIPFEVEDDTAKYHMKMYRPTLNFKAHEKYAHVTIPIDGKIFKKSNKKEVELDTGMYYLEVDAPIWGIAGKDTTGEKPKTHEELLVATKAPTHTTIHFPVIQTDEQKGNIGKGTYHLTFHFGHIPSNNWKLGTKNPDIPVPAALAAAKTLLSIWISQYLDGVDNTIARINRANNITNHLQPKSFMFATVGTNEKPVLIIYMKVQGGTSEVGQTTVDFFDPKHGISPIPTDHTASIIVANEIVHERIIYPAINKSKWIVYRKGNIDGNGGDDGFDYEIRVQETFKHREIKSDSPATLFGSSHHLRHREANVKLEDYGLKLRIRDEGAAWGMYISNAYVDWEELVMVPMAESPGLVESYQGKIKLEFKIDKASDFLKIDSSTLENAAFSLAASDVKIAASVENLRSNFNNSKYMPDEYNHLKMEFTTHEVPQKTMNMILTENILASDGNLIKLDTAHGVKTPHDVLLMGNVEWTTK